jgi:putative peptide zinc metalloprotease protein
MGANSSLIAARRHDIELHPDPETDRIIVTDNRNGRQFRLSQAAVSVLELLDGRCSPLEIARRLGGGAESSEEVRRAVERLVSIGLATAPRVVGGRHRTAHGRHRSHRPDREPLVRTVANFTASLSSPGRSVRFNPPASVELSFGSPHRMLGKLSWIGNWLAKPRAGTGVLAFTAAGIIAYGLAWPATYRNLSAPATIWVVLLVLLVTLLTTAAHELAHGLVLRRYGGRVRRLGFMIMYGSPALFCDVSDSWRLPRAKRVKVALAGVRLHAFFAAAVGWALFALPGRDLPVSQALGLAGMADLAMSVINLLPFVKFDGYVALVGWTDIPHLRIKAMRLAGATLGGLVFGRGGKQPAAELTGKRWIAFGVASAVTAPVLVCLAVLDYGPVVLAVAGPVGAAAAILTMLGLLFLPVRSVTRSVMAAQRRGVPLWRRLFGSLLIVVAVTAVFASFRVPYRESGTFDVARGTTYLILPSGSTPVPPRTTVQLQRTGIMFHPVVGHAAVCSQPRPLLVPVMAGSPVTLGNSTKRVERSAIKLCGVTGELPRSGLSTLNLGETDLYGWARATFLQPYLRQLGL